VRAFSGLQGGGVLEFLEFRFLDARGDFFFLNLCACGKGFGDARPQKGRRFESCTLVFRQKAEAFVLWSVSFRLKESRVHFTIQGSLLSGGSWGKRVMDLYVIVLGVYKVLFFPLPNCLTVHNKDKNEEGKGKRERVNSNYVQSAGKNNLQRNFYETSFFI
jgi:hypothetical protein